MSGRPSIWWVPNVGMQACGDVMIGAHEAIPHICGTETIPTSLLVTSSPRNK